MAMTPKQRQKAIDTIVANCDCWKRDGDKEILNGLSDEKIEDLSKDVEEHVQNAKIAEFVTNEESAIFDPDTQYVYYVDRETLDVKRGGGPTTNVDPDEDDDDKEDDDDDSDKRTNNRRRDTPMTEAEFWKLAPPSLKKQHDALVKNEVRNRKQMIEFIVTNESDDEDEQSSLRDAYAEMSTASLQKLTRNAQKKTNNRSTIVDNDDGDDDSLGDYSGLGLPVLNLSNRKGGGESEDHLIPPTTNYEQLSREWPSGRKVRE